MSISFVRRALRATHSFPSEEADYALHLIRDKEVSVGSMKEALSVSAAPGLSSLRKSTSVSEGARVQATSPVHTEGYAQCWDITLRIVAYLIWGKFGIYSTQRI